MPDSFDEYVLDPTTGQTIRLPSAIGGSIGLSRAAGSSLGPRGRNVVATPSLPMPVEPTAPTPVTPPTAAPPPQTVDEMLAHKQAEYERFGASPEQIAQWQEHNRKKYERFVSGPPRLAQAYIAQGNGTEGSIQNIGQPIELPRAADVMVTPQDAGDLNAMLAQEQARQAAAVPAPAPLEAAGTPPEQVGLGLQQQALDLGERAGQMQVVADQRQADAEAAEIAERNRRAEEVRQETARQEAERQKRFEELNTKYANATDEWSKYKVDPGRRWKNAGTGRKIAAAISIAMTALGDALQRKSGPNAAIEILNKAIEDDVNLQVAERDHLGKVAQGARTSLDDYRRETNDWREARSLKLAEEYKRTADEFERLAAVAKSDKSKANGLALAADYRQRAGALQQGVAQSAFSREMQQAKFAEDRRQARVAESQRAQQIAQADRHFNARLEFDREQLAAQQKSAVDEWSAKASAEQAKNLRENGIKDPTTGQYIIAGGQPVMARNVAEASKIQETVDGTQTMLSTIDRIKAKIANDPGFAKLNPTEKQAALASEIDGLTVLIKDAYTLGTLDKGMLEFTDKYTGGDPTKITSNGLFGALGLGADAGEKTIAKLDVVAKNAETRALNRMGNPKGYKFTRDERLEKSEANKAAEEARKGSPTTASAVRSAEPGAIKKGLQDVESFVFGTTQDYKKQRDAIESGGSMRYPGFRADKEAALDTLVSGVRHGDEQSATRLLEMVRDQKVPGLSDATMTLIEANAQELIPRALAELPEERRSLRQSIYAARNRGVGPGIQVYPGAGVKLPERR